VARRPIATRSKKRHREGIDAFVAGQRVNIQRGDGQTRANMHTTIASNPMNSRALKNWAAFQFALRVAKTVISKLEERSVRALPVKGLLLAPLIYDPTERSSGDIDLIVSPADFPKILQRARESSWELVWDSLVLGNVNFIVDGLAFDVMSSFGPTGISAIRVPELFARAARATDPLGFPHWQIEQHDHALLLALDAFKDKLGSGKRWAREDLVRIARRDGFSPAILVERAGKAKLLTMLSMVADWVVANGATAEWVSVQKELRSLPLRQMYIEHYRKILQPASASRWQRFYLSVQTRAVSDSLRVRASAVALGALGTARYLLRHGNLDKNSWQNVHPKEKE
jgi:hypothetical protein